MNIHDKFPIKFVRWAVENGLELTLCRDYIDLNTGMKSHLHLYYEDGNYIAKMRYDEIRIIEDFSDIHFAVRNCEHGHGRGFLWSSILTLYQNNFEWPMCDEEFC